MMSEDALNYLRSNARRMPNGWHEIGRLAVDAGFIMLGDPCYYDEQSIAAMRDAWENPDKDPSFWDRFVREADHGINRLPFDHSEDLTGDLAAITVKSGFGDGCYPVFAKYQDGLIMSLYVDFSGNSDDRGAQYIHELFSEEAEA